MRLVGRVTPVRAVVCERAARRGLRALPFAFAAVSPSRYAPRMDLPTRKKLPHTIPQWVAEGSWFFITINCVSPGKKPTVPPGRGRRRACRYEIQP